MAGRRITMNRLGVPQASEGHAKLKYQVIASRESSKLEDPRKLLELLTEQDYLTISDIDEDEILEMAQPTKAAKRSTEDTIKNSVFANKGVRSQQTASMRKVNLTVNDEDEEDEVMEDNLNEKINTVTNESVESLMYLLENKYEMNRNLVVHDGVISTPLHVLKQFSNVYKESMHSEVVYIRHPATGARMVRVELFVGNKRGVGESFTKKMSTQMAALDMISEMEKTGFVGTSNQHLPYAFLPGCRINPRVTNDLMMTCWKNQMKTPKFVPGVNDDPRRPPHFMECWIGTEMIARAESESSQMARKLAACDALELITKVPYRKEYIAMGKSCLSYEQLVELGFNPVISDFKKSWLLTAALEGESKEFSGVDDSEVRAVLKEENRGSSIKITIANNFKQGC